MSEQKLYRHPPTPHYAARTIAVRTTAARTAAAHATMAARDAELDAVESALNAIALAESASALEKVVGRLLPGLLAALATKSAPARNKIIETLTHINVRLRAEPALALPFDAVLNVAVDPAAAPMTRNVAIQGGYVARCFARLSEPDKAARLPRLVDVSLGINGGNRDALHALALLSLRAAAENDKGVDMLWACLEATNEASLHAFLGFGLRALRGKTKVTASLAELLAIVRLGVEYAGIKQPERAARVLPHMLVAAGCAQRSSLESAGEDALKRLDSCEVLAAHDPAVVDVLFELFRDPLAELSQRMVILSKGLLRTSLSASCFPEVLDVVQASLHEPGIPARLQALGMQYVSYVVANATDGALHEHGPQLLSAIMKLVENDTEGSPSFPPAVRGFGYTSLAELVVRHPSLTVAPELFFDAAQSLSSPPEVRSAASQALGVLARVRKCERGSPVLPVLLRAIGNSSDEASSARGAAVLWANECFTFDDCEARLVNVIAAADSRPDVRQAALNGLFIRSKDETYPDFVELMSVVSAKAPSLTTLPIASWTTLLKFGIRTLKHNAAPTLAAGQVNPSLVSKYMQESKVAERRSALGILRKYADNCLLDMQNGGVEVERASLSVILFTARVVGFTSSVADAYSSRIDRLISLCARRSSAGGGAVVDALARLVGIASTSLSSDALKIAIVKMGSGLAPNASGRAASRQEEDARVAAILSLGYVMAKHRYGVEEELLTEQCANIARRVTLAVESSVVVRRAACSALAAIGAKGPLPLTLDARAITLASIAGIATASSTEAKLVEAAANALGQICVGEPRSSMKRTAIDALLLLARDRKEDEVRFAAAESLVRCASGFDAPPPVVVTDTAKSSEEEELTELLAFRQEAHTIREVISDDDRATKGTELSDVLTSTINLCVDERPNARASGCVCLFTFLRLIGSALDDEQHIFVSPADQARFERTQADLARVLPNAQRAFSTLLADRSDFVQQLASCGVALVYEMCPPKEQRDLVSNLVRSLTSGKARAASTVAGDQGGILELGLPNAKPSEGSGASTYKELCSLAQDMGKPELVYKFMDLAGHNALWNNRRGAALAGSALLDSEVAAEQLRPHVQTLLPRLYVYCYDPSEGVRVAMASVLGAVVKAAGLGSVSAAVSAHYDTVVEYCLKSMSSRQWRVREGACGALREALISRTWEQVKGRLAEFWYITLRALDDIKESVRKAAAGTGRALSELSVHLCDPSQSGAEIAAQAVAVIVRSVLPAFTHAVVEVRTLATETLVRVIRFGGDALKPSLPDLVEALLEAATELEPQALNYAQFHVSEPGELEKLRADAAAMSNSPVIDSLERLSVLVDETVADSLVPKMTRLTRVGVGIPTRAATARFFSSLLRARASIMQPYAARLMNAAVIGANMDRNPTVRKSWCSAVGSAAKLAPDDAVARLARQIAAYSGSEDAQERAFGSYLALGLWTHSPDTARKHATAILPVAYMGRYEGDENAQGATANWREVWSEGAPSTEAGLRLYAKEISAICERRLANSSQYKVKRSAAAALGAMAAASNTSVAVEYLARAASSLIAALPGHIWDGKIAAIEAIGTIAETQAARVGIWADVGGPIAVVDALLKECCRGKKDYRLAAMGALAKVLCSCRDEHDMFSTICGALSSVWTLHDVMRDAAESEAAADASRLVWETGTDADAVDARNKARKAERASCVAGIACLEASFADEDRPSVQADHIGTLVGVFESVMQEEWEVRIGTLEALQRSMSRAAVKTLTTAAEGSVIPRVFSIAGRGVNDGKYAALRRVGLSVLHSVGQRMESEADPSALAALLPSELKSAILNARECDGDQSVQSSAKKVCAVFGLQREQSTSTKMSVG